MSPFTIGLIAFVIVFGGALAGMLLRNVVPTHHLSDQSREVVKLGTGLVGTMAALVLGLLIASAKGAYDVQSTELTQMSANVILLDRVLARYGPEATQARAMLRKAVVGIHDQVWSKDRSGTSPWERTIPGAENLFDQIQGLSPKDDMQRSLQSQALSVTMNLGQMRWLVAEQGATSVSRPLLIVMVFWLTIIFIGWGLLTPPNGTVVVTMFVSALSVSGAILLILEMYSPYQGWMQISDAPLRLALAHLGQ